MKKIYDDDDENGFQDIDKAKILVTVIPFVLIIIILAITLLVNSCNNKESEQNHDELQESIMDYADDKLSKEEERAEAATPLSKATPEKTKEQEKLPEATKKPEATPTPYKSSMETVKDYSKIEYDADVQLKDMMSYWADNNHKALDDLVNTDHYKAMSWSLKGTDQFYYYGDVNASGQPHGMGIAVYADNQYYYGGWANGVRSGNGTWMHYHIHEKADTKDIYTYHQYTGGWANDLPDGEGSEHYDYNMELLTRNGGYVANLIGSYRNGLIDGEFYLTNIYKDGNVKEWYADASKGSWVPIVNQPDKQGRYPVHVEDRDEENYIWMHPSENQNIGVQCLITPDKN